MATLQTGRTWISKRNYSQSAGMLVAGALAATPLSIVSAGAYTQTTLVSRQDNSALLMEISSLKERVAKLEAAIEIVEELDWDDALARGRIYFDSHPGKPIFPDELAAEISTSISQAIEVCEALQKEGAVV